MPLFTLPMALRLSRELQATFPQHGCGISPSDVMTVNTELTLDRVGLYAAAIVTRGFFQNGPLMAIIGGKGQLMAFSFAVSDVARRLGVPPRVISDLFYQRALDDARCPVVCGRRVIPEEYVPEIEKVLRERNLLPTVRVAGSNSQ